MIFQAHDSLIIFEGTVLMIAQIIIIFVGDKYLSRYFCQLIRTRDSTSNIPFSYMKIKHSHEAVFHSPSFSGHPNLSITFDRSMDGVEMVTPL